MFPFLLIYTSVRHRSREAPQASRSTASAVFHTFPRFFRIFGAPSALFGAFSAYFLRFLALFGRFFAIFIPLASFLPHYFQFFPVFDWGGEDKVAASGPGRSRRGREGAERTRSPKRRGTQLSMREGRVKSEEAMVGRGFAPAAVARQMVGRGCSRRRCAANGRAGGLSAFARSVLHLIATTHGRGHFTHPSRSAGSWGCASCGGRRSG